MTYADPQTKEYWLRVFAALKFVEGYSTEQLEGRTLGEVLDALSNVSVLLDGWNRATDRPSDYAREKIRDADATLAHFRPAPSDNQEEQSDGE